ncbi:hypothetical protein [Sphaerotilus mobilis]|nr:hypothetical protein [Sphaerotilus mobilis]
MVSRSKPLRSPAWRRLAVHIAWWAVLALALLPTLVRTVAHTGALTQAGQVLPMDLCGSLRVAGAAGAAGAAVAAPSPADTPAEGAAHATLDACAICVLAASVAAVPVPTEASRAAPAPLASDPLPALTPARPVSRLAASIARPRGPPLRA